MTRLIIALALLQALACSKGSPKNTYIKIFGIDRAKTATTYNKGLTVSNFFYFNLSRDSVLLRYNQSNIDQYFIDSFNTYIGFSEHRFIDSILPLFTFLQNIPYEGLDYLLDSNNQLEYNGKVFLEFQDEKGIHYMVLNDLTNDTLTKVVRIIHDLESSSWKKSKVSTQQFNDTVELVSFLKGAGLYDSLLTPYIPLPCETGIDMDKLFGAWRTIGDKYNDATFKYWLNTINKNGDWNLGHYYDGKLHTRMTGKIISFNKNSSLIVKGDSGLSYIQILNLTESCLQYKYKGSDQVWRFDRMK